MQCLHSVWLSGQIISRSKLDLLSFLDFPQGRKGRGEMSEDDLRRVILLYNKSSGESPRPCGESANIGVKLPPDIGGLRRRGEGQVVEVGEGRVDQTQHRSQNQ